MNKKIAIAVLFAGIVSIGGSARLSAHCGKCGVEGDHSSKAGVKAGGVDEKVNHLGKSLGLSDAQKAQIKPIIEEAWAKKDALMKQHKEQMEAVHKEKADKISSILTPEQKAKWDAMKADGQKMKGGKGKMKGCGHCGTAECICGDHK